MSTEIRTDRRGLLKGGASVSATASLSSLFTVISARQAAAATNARGEQTEFVASPYGPVAPVNDLNTGLPLLQLPGGFSYRSFGWTGDRMSDGQPTPAWHDGMAVVTSGSGRTAADVLIRNHEYRNNGAKFAVKNPANLAQDIAQANYDDGTAAVGGCTALRIRNGQLLDHRAVIAGTDVNCAGGSTPWGSWITCEETVQGVGIGGGGRTYAQTHGWVFEVSANPAQTVAQPITDMGRFAHEAISVDPLTREIYLTEDARNIALLYCVVPNARPTAYGQLRANGGALYAAKVRGVDKANLLALQGPLPSDVSAVGQELEIEWVRIPDPAAAPVAYAETNPTLNIAGGVSGTFAQGRDRGALRMSRGEGMWYSRQEAAFYYADTAFGYNAAGVPGRGTGAIWRYKPNRADPRYGTLKLVYASANRSNGEGLVGNNPDNVTVSPRGGVLTMEDGDATNRILGFQGDGQAYVFAVNNIVLDAAGLATAGKVVAPGDYRGQEFAGGCFNAVGNTFYVNVQTPGITFAITGPWSRGNI